MNDASRFKLQSVLNTLETEADPIAVKLEEYHNEIARLEKMTEAMKDRCSEADLVFSPRSSKQGEELKQKLNHLEEVKKKCSKLQERYEQLNQNIDLIVEVLSCDSDIDATKNGLVYQEQDRHRIARDLHDTALQHLANIVEKLDSCKDYIDENPLKAKMELSMARHTLNESIDEIRGVIYDLRPMVMDAEGFHQSLIDMIEMFNEDQKFEVTSDIEELACDDQIVMITIYRIIEECLSNIRQHAEAYKIHVIVQEQIGSYYIYVEDDGKGFDLDKVFINNKLQFGLSILKERVALLGGTVTITSAPNAGTQIKVLIPATD